ncbi:hypothetical protein E1B28_003352 [Marasmius oreades]|uniref:DUF6533 domain-containing protein n=1 Tax=Marasmius oreades TaxID=181124 RepID=A0A9P7RLE8_9AGAR|nr:uncharacterized protein E1B28_003352 [Marasmius oreades]KAG7085814.1 hypothetical protein E1B28_003352 [Marasmius oreades]
MLLDHIYTLDVEIKYLWQPRRTRHTSSYIFFLHRYMNLFAASLSFMSIDIMDLPFSCDSIVFFREAMLLLAQVIVACILSLRIYALYGCNRSLLSFMLSLLAILSIISGALNFSGRHDDQLQAIGTCHTLLDRNTSIRQCLGWVMVFMYDTMIVGLAVCNAFKTRMELQILRHMKVSLKVILLRDGAIYFGIMSVVHLANILTYFFAEGYMRGGLAPFASSISVTLVSRLMLNLHEVVDTGIYMSSCTSFIDQPEEETHISFYRPPGSV